MKYKRHEEAEASPYCLVKERPPLRRYSFTLVVCSGIESFHHNSPDNNKIFKTVGDFPGDAVVKNLPADAGDTGSSPGPGRSHMPWSN